MNNEQHLDVLIPAITCSPHSCKIQCSSVEASCNRQSSRPCVALHDSPCVPITETSNHIRTSVKTCLDTKQSTLHADSNSMLQDSLLSPVERYPDCFPTEKTSVLNHLHSFKSPASEISYDVDHARITDTNHSPYVGFSPIGIDLLAVNDSQSCNGSALNSIHERSRDCPTPNAESFSDFNGRSGSHTPASVTDVDRTKMDLTKLDETIDHVLAIARSDEPCEGMFVLSCRSREPVHLSSPNLRVNTPSSGLLTSPTPSPTSSPHSNRVSSPMPNPICRQQTLLQTCNLSVPISAQSLPRFVVDKPSGLMQIPSHANNKCLPNQCNSKTVSLFHLYSDPHLSSTPSSVTTLNSSLQTFTSVSPSILFHTTMAPDSRNRVQLSHSGIAHVPSNSSAPGQLCSVLSPSKGSSASGPQVTKVMMPTCSPLSTAFERSTPGPCSVLNSPPLCIVPGIKQNNPLIRDITSINHTPFSDSVVAMSSNERAPSRPTVNDTFRQPVAPTLPATSLFSPICSSSCRTVTPVCIAPPSTVNKGSGPIPVATSLKRRNNSITSLSKKRRSLQNALHRGMVPSSNSNTEVSSSTNRLSSTEVYDFFEKLKAVEPKSLVSAPVLQPYSSVLPPVGGADVSCYGNVVDENKSFRKRGFKYLRETYAMTIPKCYDYESRHDDVDGYIVQHLHSNTPSGPLLRDCNARIGLKKEECTICPSPEPPSFENNMEALFHSMHKPYHSTAVSLATDGYSRQSSYLPGATFPSQLVPMLSDTLICGKSDPERSTPPLPLFHMPNPRIICQPIHLSTGQQDRQTQPVSLVKPEAFPGGTRTVGNGSEHSLPPEQYPAYNISTAVAPVVDSETGELVFSSKHTPEHLSAHESACCDGETLNITFTISPSMSASIPKVIRRISQLLAIDESAIRYQVTRSGVQVILDQQKSRDDDNVKNLESRLREHFTPLSLKFGPQNTDSTVVFRPGTTTSKDFSDYQETPHSFPSISSQVLDTKSDSSASDNLSINRPVDDPVSITSLLSDKKESKKSCYYCDKLVSFHLVHRRCFDELALLVGLPSLANSSTDCIFCSCSCVLDYARSIAQNRSTISETQLHCLGVPICGRSLSNGDVRTQALDLVGSVPVFLHNNQQKQGKNTLKRSLTSCSTGSSAKKRSNTATTSLFKCKKWRGYRWRAFSVDCPVQPVPVKQLEDVDPTQLLCNDSSRLHRYRDVDKRTCLLCSLTADGNEDGPGRLLPLGADSWVHVNCALWCYEVYETVGGSLNNVDVWFKKARETNCSHCGRYGAGLPCYNPRCSFCFHVPCAIDVGCMFFTDRGMYCPQHQPKEIHPMQLHSLDISRRVYIARDENSQVGSVIRDEDRTFVTRIGSICLHNVGQLLPHQIDSGFFHTKRHIYPVGFETTRFYWSMRRLHCRARYHCQIEEFHFHPLFRVTAIDEGLQNETFVHETCNGVWQLILSRIAELREQHKMIRLFPKHLRGEDLFGLSEPHIVRAVESLPGVDGLRDYVFNFGRMELISGMPLAVNPTGCARSEPKMQTYVKRLHGGSSLCPTRTNIFPGLRRSVHPNPFTLTDLPSKQHQSSRSQQYRRLKAEFPNNVILGRSRIQGLGLFAARDLEPQTMVIEYIGELIRVELANKREKHYEAHNRGIYMFRLDDDTVIDASMSGGLARYINHSCRPNCYAEYLNFGEQSHIVIITNQHIEKSEELCYDYNFDLEEGGSKIPCLCRAPNCRKWMN